ncbi:MAG: ABC transporter permease [Acidimicrobiaceae bacterium]|nr:ABC transporter permease [Acidimicrobiaceae bacterium]
MINRLRLDKYSALYLWAFFMVLFTILRPDTFLTTTSFKLVTQENVINGVLALAFLIPLATGTYDLSIGLNMSACLVVINWIAKNTDLPQGVGLLLGLGVCLLAGTISGFVVVKLKVDSFIATLGMSQILTAFVLFVSPQTISGELSDAYKNVGAAQFFGLQRFVWYLLILAIIVWYVLEHTPLGRQMFATGGNPEAARLTGIRTDRLRWGSLIASALVAGFAGVVYSWKVGTYGQSIGPGYLFPAVAAVFFGASQLKGRPNVWGAMIALYALAWGVKGLNLIYTTQQWIRPLFEGVSLLAAVALASRNQIIKIRKRKTPIGQAVLEDLGVSPKEAAGA